MWGGFCFTTLQKWRSFRQDFQMGGVSLVDKQPCHSAGLPRLEWPKSLWWPRRRRWWRRSMKYELVVGLRAPVNKSRGFASFLTRIMATGHAKRRRPRRDRNTRPERWELTIYGRRHSQFRGGVPLGQTHEDEWLLHRVQVPKEPVRSRCLFVSEINISAISESSIPVEQ